MTRELNNIYPFMGIIFSILVLMSSCKKESSPVQIDDTKEIENDTVYYDKIEKEVEKDGSFVWYRYKIKEEVGALDLNRQIIIPAKYEYCYYDEHFDKFHVGRNDSAGLYNLDGSSFIDISRGYANFMKEQLTNGNYYILVYRHDDNQERNLDGLCDAAGKEILPMQFFSIDYGSLENEQDDLEDDEYTNNDISSFSVTNSKNDESFYIYKYVDSHNKIISMPQPEWDRIYNSGSRCYDMYDNSSYEASGKFQVRKYSSYVYIDRQRYDYDRSENGNKIYSKIFIGESAEGSGKKWKVEVYFEGNEMIMISENRFKTIYYKNKDLDIAALIKRKNTQEETMSKGLLYKGIYTISGQGRSQTTGQWTSDIGDRTVEIEIYKDHIQVEGLYCKFVSESNGRRKYQSLSLSGSTQSYYYVNMSDFSMSMENVFSSQFGTDWYWYAMTKGESTMPKYNNSGYSGSSNGVGHNTNSVNRQSDRNGKTWHECPTCHGAKRVERFTYPSLYGSEDYKVRCNECGQWFMRSLGHTHVTCPTCHGKGGSYY